MTGEKKVEIGKVYETKDIPEERLPQGTLVKAVSQDGDDVTVRRAGPNDSGPTLVIKIFQIIGFLFLLLCLSAVAFTYLT